MISYETDGTNLSVILAARVDRIQNPKPALLRAGLYLRDADVKRIKAGGPGWAPDAPSTVAMKGSSQPGVDTGTMMSSLTVDVDAEPFVAKVGIQGPAANRQTSGGATLANYAFWFNFGTGVYAGHSSWTIRPVNKRVLSWEAGGVRYFAREVIALGQPARPFLLITPQDAAQTARIISYYITTGKAA